MEKTRWEAGLFFVMPSITIVFLISFGLLDRCSFRTLFELEGTSKPLYVLFEKDQKVFSQLPNPSCLRGASTTPKSSPIFL